MSKISDYLQAYEKHHSKNNQPTSVKAFAEELQRPVETVIKQFAAAGILVGPDDPVSEADKQALLDHLRTQHKGPRSKELRKIVINRETEPQRQLRAVAGGGNGAEWDTLKSFTESIVFGLAVDPLMQRLVNIIIARSFVTGALPSMRRGRPKSDETERLGEEIARAYWDMRDSGMGYAEAAAELSAKYHKDERHIMRSVEKHKSAIGNTLEDRNRKRLWESALRGLYIGPTSEGQRLSAYESFLQAHELPPELADVQFDGNDCLEHLEELIQIEAAKLPPLTRNSVHLKPVTRED